jgi:hypothetical protein
MAFILMIKSHVSERESNKQEQSRINHRLQILSDRKSILCNPPVFSSFSKIKSSSIEILTEANQETGTTEEAEFS